jgi:hypothetical protein
VFVDLLAQGGQNFFGGLHADVGAEKSGFELAEQLGIDGTVAGEDLLDAGGEFRARLADGIFQAFEKRGFGWSEERDHVCGFIEYF